MMTEDSGGGRMEMRYAQSCMLHLHNTVYADVSFLKMAKEGLV